MTVAEESRKPTSRHPPLSRRERDALCFPLDNKGTPVDFASQSDLRPADISLSVNGEAVSSPPQPFGLTPCQATFRTSELFR